MELGASRRLRITWSAYAFESQQRFEERWGSWSNCWRSIRCTRRLIRKTTLERMIGYRTELELEREKQRRNWSCFATR